MFLLGAVLLTLAGAGAIMFPRECVMNVKTFPVVCCPLYNNSMCGSAFSRGNCVSVQRGRAVRDPTVTRDLRVGFPAAFFTHQCVCKDGFFGFNCGGCTFGRVGDNCDKIQVNTRLELREMSPRARELFFAQLHYAKSKLDPDYVMLRIGNRFYSDSYEFIDCTYYDCWSFAHYFATMPFLNNTRLNNNLNAAHGSSNFLPFHRLHLLHLEKTMQRCLKDPTFAIPYYDWGRDAGCDICNDGYFGANDPTGRISKFSVFSTWRMICGDFSYGSSGCQMSDNYCERPPFFRNPGSEPGFDKSGPLDIQNCLNLPIYDSWPYTDASPDSFRNCVEGFRTRNGLPGTTMHNGLHVFMSGTMAEVPISCNDPIFGMHHGFIDKIFDRSMTSRGWNADSYPSDNNFFGHRAFDCIIPFPNCWLPRDMMAPSSQFGYVYSNAYNF